MNLELQDLFNSVCSKSGDVTHVASGKEFSVADSKKTLFWTGYCELAKKKYLDISLKEICSTTDLPLNVLFNFKLIHCFYLIFIKRHYFLI